MMPQLEPVLIRSLDFMHELGALSLSGAQALVHAQIDFARTLLTHSGERMRNALSQAPEQWPEQLQIALREAAEVPRECLLAALAWQAQTMRLVERQAFQAQAIVGEALADVDVMADAGPAPARSRRTRSARAVEHRLAA